MAENIIIKKLDNDDDYNKTAQLIYETSVELFKAMFGKKEKAVPRIAALIRLDNNIFSRKYILTALIDNQVAGILVGFDVKKIDKKKVEKDFIKALSFFAQIRCLLMLKLSKQILGLDVIDFNSIDGLYIQNLCVDSAHRKKGIGYKLLEHYISKNNPKGSKNICLDVESTNIGAIRLYKKIGFETYDELFIKPAKITLYKMRKK